MRIAIEVDQTAFVRPKSREELEREVLEAATIYWLARHDIDQSQIRAANATRGEQPAAADRPGLIDVLLSAPLAGEDADFRRVQDTGRPDIEWDT